MTQSQLMLQFFLGRRLALAVLRSDTPWRARPSIEFIESRAAVAEFLVQGYEVIESALAEHSS